MNTALKAIDTKIASIRRRTGTLRSDIAACALLIMSHSKEHGDCSRALRLVEAVPMASERIKLMTWFRDFSPINVTWNADASKRRVGYLPSTAKNFNEFNIDGATANPYFEYGKSDDQQTADLLAADLNDKALALAKRFEKALGEGKVAANDVDNVKAKIIALRNVATVTAVAA